MKFLKIGVVIIGALVVTALGIDAADTMRGSEGTLLSQVIRSESFNSCPSGMVAIENHPSLTCVDIYEVSTGGSCPKKEPKNMFETQENMESKGCLSESKEGATPWRFVTREQAINICATTGKRLPSASEWYALATGIARSDAVCNVSSHNLSDTGAFSECKSPNGAYDLIGNVWEWVNDDVIEGKLNDRALPESGYVVQVDNAGVATVTGTEEQILYGSDYFWTKNEGAYGVIRGGFYDSGKDAGMYAVHADTAPSSAGTAIGFRCVK